MKSNSFGVFIETLNAVTFVPFDINGGLDFSGLTDPGKSIIEKRWDEFIESGGELEIIADPEPVIEQPPPNYPGFNAYMLTNPMFKYYRDIVRGIDGDLNSALFDGYGLVETNGVEAFLLVWSAWIQISGIVSADKEAIAMTAKYFNLPTEFVAIIRG